MPAGDTVNIFFNVGLGDAAQQTRKLGESLEDVADKADKVEGSLKKVADKGADASDVAGKADSAMKGLAGGLDAVDVKGGELASTMGDVAGGIEVVASASKLSLGPLALLAAAVAAAAAAYTLLKAELAKADQALMRQQGLARNAEQLKEQLDLLKLQKAALTDAGAAQELAARQAENQGRAMSGAAAISRQLKDAQDELNRAQQGLGGDTEELTKKVNALKAELALAETFAEQMEKVLLQTAETEKTLEENTKKATEAIKAQTEAMRAQVEGPGGLRISGPGGATSQVFQGAIDPTTGLAATTIRPDAMVTLVDKDGNVTILNAPEQTISARLPDAPEQSTFNKLLAKQFEIVLGPLAALAQGNAAGAIQGALGIAGVAGPQGAAVAAGIQGLQTIADKGPEGVRAELFDFADDMETALEALPEIITEVIPDFVEKLITDLIPALIESFPKLVIAIQAELPVAIAKAVVLGLVQLLVDFKNALFDFIMNLPENIAKALASLLKIGGGGGFLGLGRDEKGRGFFQRGLFEEVGKVIKGDKKREFATGGLNDRTQLALVHAGERVIPQSGAGSQAVVSRDRNRMAAGMGGMGGLTFQGPVIGSMRDLLRGVDRSTGPFGLGFSTAIQDRPA